MAPIISWQDSVAVRRSSAFSVNTIHSALIRIKHVYRTSFCCLQILVRVHQQFEHFLSKEQSVDHQVLMAVLKTLAKIGPNADPVFRDECKSIIIITNLKNKQTE